MTHFLRLLLFICFVVASTNDASEEAATTPTPEQAFNAAVKHAEDATARLEARVRDLRNTAHNKTLIHAIQTKFLKNGSSTRQEVLHSVREIEEQAKTHMRGLRSVAKKAARDIKSRAQQVEKASKKAGAHEHDYERAYDQAEHLSERMEDRAENLGDTSENYVEAIYETVLDGTQQHYDEVERRAEASEKRLTSGSKVTSSFVSPEMLLAEPASSEEYNVAVKQAELAIAALDTKVRDLRTTAHNKTLIAAIQTKFLKNASSTRRQVLQSVRRAEAETKTHVRGLSVAAKKAARAVKAASRKAEKASRKAGVHERDYEKAYMQGERASERMELHVESLGDASEEYVEGIYETVLLGVESHFEEAERQAEVKEQNVAVADRKQASAVVSPEMLLAEPAFFFSGLVLLADEAQVQSRDQDYTAAVKRAEDAVVAMETKVGDLRNTAHNKTLIAAAQTKILKNVGNATYHDVYHSVLETAARTKTHMRDLRTAAKKAARGIKSAARKVEEASKKAGAHEHDYERAYDRAEHLSEHMEDHVGNLGDASEEYVEVIRESVLDGVERHFAEAQRQAKAARSKASKSTDASASILALPTLSSTDMTLLMLCITAVAAGMAVKFTRSRRAEEEIETYTLLA
jgi:hypothetical protein